MIRENLIKLKKKLPQEVTLVAVSKTKPISVIKQAYESGQRVFGENKIQEMLEKYQELPKDIEWHMIGHLQRNKVKYMAHFVDLVHGVDSFNTLKEIDKQAKKHNRIIKCLLQVRIAQEQTKFGLSFEQVDEIVSSQELTSLENVKVVGLMGMATFTDDSDQIISEFSSLKSFYDQLESRMGFEVLSMGMSGDYRLAIQCGSSMVRIGSSIFGRRN